MGFAAACPRPHLASGRGTRCRHHGHLLHAHPGQSCARMLLSAFDANVHRGNHWDCPDHGISWPLLVSSSRLPARCARCAPGGQRSEVADREVWKCSHRQLLCVTGVMSA